MAASLNCMTHNLERPLKDRDKRRSAGRTAIQKAVGGIGVLNEVHRADVRYYKRYLKSLGMTWYRSGSNAIVWDPRVLKNHRVTARRIMRGGYVGADGTPEGPDNRRVGPHRYNLKWEGEHIASGFPLMVNGTHKMAKSYTSAKWRLALLLRSHRNLAKDVQRSIEKYPNGFIAGDENSIPYVRYPGLNDTPVKTPPTLGNKRYDQVHTFGDVRASKVREFKTPSNHDGVEWKLILDVV